MRSESSFQIALNWPYIGKVVMTSQITDMMSPSIFLERFVSIVMVSYWSKFHVNIITSSGVMIIFIYQD